MFSGQIGYALVPLIARGLMLGPDQPVILHMLDIEPAAEALNGVKMELIDSALPLLKGVVLFRSLELICCSRILNFLSMVDYVGFEFNQELLPQPMLWKHAKV